MMKNLFKNCLKQNINLPWRIILKYRFLIKPFHLKPNNFISYCQTNSFHTANLFINAFHLSSVRFSFAGHNSLLFLLTSKEKNCQFGESLIWCICYIRSEVCLLNVKVSSMFTFVPSSTWLGSAKFWPRRGLCKHSKTCRQSLIECLTTTDNSS